MFLQNFISDLIKEKRWSLCPLLSSICTLYRLEELYCILQREWQWKWQIMSYYLWKQFWSIQSTERLLVDHTLKTSALDSQGKFDIIFWVAYLLYRFTFYFMALWCSIWNLSSLIRDQTCVLCISSTGSVNNH